MSKSIKVDEATYKRLDKYRGKGETFSLAIEKLLMAAKTVKIAYGELQGNNIEQP